MPEKFNLPSTIYHLQLHYLYIFILIILFLFNLLTKLYKLHNEMYIYIFTFMYLYFYQENSFDTMLSLIYIFLENNLLIVFKVFILS